MKNTHPAASEQAPNCPPFLNIPFPVAQHSGLSQTAKLVYGALNRLHKINSKRGKDTFKVSQQTLASQVGKSARTVKRAIWELRGKPAADGSPQFSPLVVILKAGRCNYYQLLPLQDSPQADVDNSQELGTNEERIGDKSGPRIEGAEGGGPCTPSNKDYALDQGLELLDTEGGKRLIKRLVLLCYDWNVENPELSTLHRKNRQRKNRQDVAQFVGQCGLQALEWAIETCERTSLDNGAAVLRKILSGGLFPSEKKKLGLVA
jgi:hypothetical protein